MNQKIIKVKGRKGEQPRPGYKRIFKKKGAESNSPEGIW
jgi:hypothetical protein